MAKRRKTQFDKLAQSIADQMTPEQACRLYEFIDPLTPEQHAQFDKMSDDELLRALAE